MASQYSLTPQGGTLVHLNLQAAIDSDSRISSIIVRERPFIGDLALDAEPDKDLLIAVGEVMDVAQPLTVNRISCMGRLAILWIDENRWLVLPPAGAHESVLQALRETFGEDLQIEKNAQQQNIAKLNSPAIHYLLSSANTQQFSDLPVTEAELQKGIQVMSLQDTQGYDVLVRKSCAESLWQWLQKDSQPNH